MTSLTKGPFYFCIFTLAHHHKYLNHLKQLHENKHRHFTGVDDAS